jgi:hypothetical protein
MNNEINEKCEKLLVALQDEENFINDFNPEILLKGNPKEQEIAEERFVNVLDNTSSAINDYIDILDEYKNSQ